MSPPGSDTRSADELLERVHELEAEVARRDSMLRCLESSMDGIWDWDVESGDDYLSPAWKRSLGFEPYELTDRVETWQELVHPDDLPTAFAAVEAHLERGQPYSVVLRYLRKDGSIAWMLARGAALRDADGECVRMIGTHTDITELKNAQAELGAAHSRLEAEVLDRTNELDRKVEQLEQANKELERFVQVAAHDLQEPVRAITSFGQLIRTESLDELGPDTTEYMDFMIEGAVRLQGLIQDLRDYGRAGRLQDDLEPCDLSAVIDRILRRLTPELGAASIDVTVGSLPVVLGTPRSLDHIFAPLLANAIQYRGAIDPVLRITATEEGPNWVVSVADNGLGIEEEYHEQVFGVFRRLHTRSEGSGNGIGLAIARRAATRLGGSLVLQSELGRGSVFSVRLPKAPEDGS